MFAFLFYRYFNANSQFLNGGYNHRLPVNSPVTTCRKMHHNCLQLLNGAYKTGATPDLNQINLSDIALSSISSLWENKSFYMLGNRIIDKGYPFPPVL